MTSPLKRNLALAPAACYTPPRARKAAPLNGIHGGTNPSNIKFADFIRIIIVVSAARRVSSALCTQGRSDLVVHQVSKRRLPLCLGQATHSSWRMRRINQVNATFRVISALGRDNSQTAS